MTKAVQIFSSAKYKLATGLAKGHRVCAIGDVHGDDRHMAALLDGFAARNDKYEKTTLVLLGDLNDRGNNSFGCFDLAISASKRFDEVICLQGNHEAILRIVIEQDRPDVNDVWHQFGGQAVIDEIGRENLDFSSQAKFKTSLKKNIGKKRMKYLRNLSSHHHIGNLLFVHAGTNPNASLEAHFAQVWDKCFGDHWCWIREPFLHNPVDFKGHKGLTVVHGHTPQQRVAYKKSDDLFAAHQWQDGKLNLDGGSYASGCVTGAEFTHKGYRLNCAIIYI
ncbi:MAG: metallophosphoesterase [Alphaproteobacteria bacterium]|nr:metallophosphoesterase [Alphaproteobacteria bacterium]